MAQLKLHKKRIEEAKRRDHRTVGKKLNLFSIQEDAGGGMVFWHPKGSIIRRVIEDYWKDEHVKVKRCPFLPSTLPLQALNYRMPHYFPRLYRLYHVS